MGRCLGSGSLWRTGALGAVCGSHQSVAPAPMPCVTLFTKVLALLEPGKIWAEEGERKPTAAGAGVTGVALSPKAPAQVSRPLCPRQRIGPETHSQK